MVANHNAASAYGNNRASIEIIKDIGSSDGRRTDPSTSPERELSQKLLRETAQKS